MKFRAAPSAGAKKGSSTTFEDRGPFFHKGGDPFLSVVGGI